MVKLHLIKNIASRAELREAWKRTVRALAAEQYGMDPAALMIDADARGKPFLAGHPDFHFSVSHTAGLLVIAVADREVGVDAEKMRPVRRKIADRFFTPHECDCITSEESFFTVWTRKEAYLKYTGTGIRVPLASFDVMDGSLPVRIDSFVWEGYVISCCTAE
jgi:4'-phosphopantetheinyl transferase